jgi:acyl carrier protein
VSGAVTDTEDWVLRVCRELGLRVSSPDDDFFEAGASSLTATKLISRADEAYGQDALDPEDLFSRSTIREIAAHIRVRR